MYSIKFRKYKLLFFILFVVFVTLITNFLLSYKKTPINGSNLFYRDTIGRVYVDVTSHCLDICLFRSYKRLVNVDLNTFIDIGGGYAKDNKRVYFHSEIVAGADPNSFTFKNRIARDNENLYEKGYLVFGVNENQLDLASVKNISAPGSSCRACLEGAILIEDNNFVYIVVTRHEFDDRFTLFPNKLPYIQKLQLVDKISFVADEELCSNKYRQLINPDGYSKNNSCIAYDKNFIYTNKEHGITIEYNLNPMFQFKKLGEGYFELNGKVYFLFQPLNSVNVRTFRYLGQNMGGRTWDKAYAKDISKVYYGSEVLSRADEKTFSVIYANYARQVFAYDKYNRYFRGTDLTMTDKYVRNNFDGVFANKEVENR